MRWTVFTARYGLSLYIYFCLTSFKGFIQGWLSNPNMKSVYPHIKAVLFPQCQWIILSRLNKQKRYVCSVLPTSKLSRQHLTHNKALCQVYVGTLEKLRAGKCPAADFGIRRIENIRKTRRFRPTSRHLTSPSFKTTSIFTSRAISAPAFIFLFLADRNGTKATGTT